MQIKEHLKKNIFVVKTYENLWMLYNYFNTKRYVKKSKNMVTQEDLRRIQKYKGIHKGERCFIVGQGPSLTIEDLEKIKGEISFTVNSGPAVYKKTDWRAQYYAAFDDFVFDRVRKLVDSEYKFSGIFVNNIDSKNFNHETPLRSIEDREEMVFLPTDFSCTYCLDTVWDEYFPSFFNSAGFSNDITERIYSGTTVVYTCIQIAAYMGFNEIYLLGVDCDYSMEIKHSEIAMDGPELDYEKREWMRAERIQLKQFQKLAEKGLPSNLKVYNASRGGKLEAFPRKALSEIIK